MILFLIAVVAAMLIVFKVQKAREMEQENRFLQSYMMSMQELYHVVRQRIEAVRRYRHDLAGHIQTLEALLNKSGSQEGMHEYMQRLKETYSELEEGIFCPDEIVDSVISIKNQECIKKQIPLEIQIEDADYSRIEEIDMVGVLHNLLDNAVEANERIGRSAEDQRGIFLQMGRQGDRVMIVVANCIPSDETVSFTTSKADREAHGIGISIIQGIVQKYGGSRDVTVDEKERRLTTTIVL